MILARLAAFAALTGVYASEIEPLVAPFTAKSWTAKGQVHKQPNALLLGPEQNSVASIWTQEPNPYEEWTFEAVVRVAVGPSSPGRSGVALWYTNRQLDLGAVHGSADYWDGLAIMMDSLGYDEIDRPPQDSGALRGHLNDGTTSFLSEPHPANQAFALCRIPYRLSRSPISIRIGYGRGWLIIEANGQRCFATNEVRLPVGYFGVSAATDASEDRFYVDSASLKRGISEIEHQIPPPRPPQSTEYESENHRENEHEQAEPQNAAGALSPPQPRTQEAGGTVWSESADALRQPLMQGIQELKISIESLKSRALAEGLSDKVEETLARILDQLAALDARLSILRVLETDLATQARDIQTLRATMSQMNELQQQVFNRWAAERAQPRPSGGTSMWQIALAAAGGQVLVVLMFQMARRRRHSKLL